MPKIVDSAAQRREIRRAAGRVFARRGVVGTGLGRVAEAAGMGRTSLYHYYKDKASLVRDLVRDLLAQEEAVFLDAARGAGPPLERLERLAAAMPSLFQEWTGAGRLLLELRSRDRRLFRPFFRRIRAALASLVAEGQRRGEVDRALDPERVAASAIGLIDGLLLQHMVEPGAIGEPAALGEEIARSLRRLVQP